LRHFLLIAVLFAGCSVTAKPRLLVVTATAGFRHDSIATAETVVERLANARGIEVVFARDEAAMLQRLTARELQSISAVCFINTTGELPASAREALLTWIAAGGTFVGFHAASDTWHFSPEYIAMVGAEFESHPDQSTVTIDVVDPTHKATRGLTTPLVIFEEIYSFKNFTPSDVKPLLMLRDGHPLAWEKTFGAGRVFYSALGHREDIWLAGWFARHVDGAISWSIEREKRRVVRH
jgi:type 1 glutamine amidotransferase